MYLNHFGLDEPPFRITPHTDFFFGGANRGATLEALLYAITHDEGIVKVSGEVGSGKTMLSRVLMERLPGQVRTILLSNPSLSRDEIVYAIAEELEVQPPSERMSALLIKLQEHLVKLYGENQRVVLLIDEAHAMPQETLEQIRLLSNIESSHSKLLQIVLFGQPELDEHLNLPHMRQLKERITHSFRLEPMVRADIEDYLDFRLRAAGYRGPKLFAPDAVRRIVKASEGLTRRVNILADKALLAAFADNEHGISTKHVNRAIRDSEFYRPPVSKVKIGLAAGGVAAGLTLGLGLHYLLAPPSPTPTAQTAAPATPAAVATSPSASTSPSQNEATPAEAASAATTLPHVSAAVPGVAPIDPGLVAPAVPANPPTPAPQHVVSAPIATKTAATPVATAGPAPTLQNAAVKAAPTAGAPAAIAAAVQPIDPEIPAGAKPGSDNYVPPAPPRGKLTRQRFSATQEWLKTAPGDHYSIQLLTAGSRDLQRIEDVLARASARNLNLPDFHVYGVMINDQQHYRVAYGLYPTLLEVNQGIKSIPPDFRQFGPFYRSVERMRSQNRQ
jgi:type II secretory pathway predicted ATPase ExeA/septal ring-binding cell division protein DamX